MSNVFFTSDTHFGHRRCALEFRGFKSVEDHDELLIKRWNELVKNSDLVYHLGDFSICGYGKAFDVLSRLNGNKYFIFGNHDNDIHKLVKTDKSLFIWHKDVEYKKINNQKVFMSHYAHRVWRSSHYGSWHLYGHSHGNLEDDPNSLSMDVGVDTNDYRPYSFDEVRERMEAKDFKPVDHHV